MAAWLGDALGNALGGWSVVVADGDGDAVADASADSDAVAVGGVVDVVCALDAATDAVAGVGDVVCPHATVPPTATTSATVPIRRSSIRPPQLGSGSRSVCRGGVSTRANGLAVSATLRPVRCEGEGRD